MPVIASVFGLPSLARGVANASNLPEIFHFSNAFSHLVVRGPFPPDHCPLMLKSGTIVSRFGRLQLRLRADNGPQYTSSAFRESMKALGLRLEHIMYGTPEQNGSIESFHKTLKREYIWPFDFGSFQDAETATDRAFIDYNQNRIHSSLGYLTPYEFVELWNCDEEQNKTEEEKLNVC